ncbi:MAG TPA: hypothetical protein VGC54_14320 [Planctomycetota bacterium]
MNLDTLWQTHRRFLTAVAVGLALFLIAEMIISSVAGSGAAAARRSINISRASLATAKYSSAQVAELRTRLEQLEARTAELTAAALPPWRQEFRPSAGQSARQHYIEFTGSMRQELVAWALRNDVEIDETLGLPPISPTQGRDIERALRGFDVVERVVRMAVPLGAARIENVEISTRGTRRRQRGMPESPLDLAPVAIDLLFAEEDTLPFVQALLDVEPPLGLMLIDLGPVQARTKLRRLTVQFAVGEPPQAETRP